MMKKLILFIGNNMANLRLSSEVKSNEFNDSHQNKLSQNSPMHMTVLDQS